MSLTSQYKRQFAWRDWARVFAALPPLDEQLVIDLGCAVGDQAAELAARGARVVGVDTNEELLAAARARAIERAEFRRHDLGALPDLGVVADGLWCSFAAAYFPDLSRALASWATSLRAGGWIALTEIDDLFGHEPLGARSRALLDAFARDSLAAARYDFHMGRKLRRHLERSGFTVRTELTLDDAELSFSGPARPDVLEGWRARLDRMKVLQAHCGPEFAAVRDDLLDCLARADHWSTATVRCCIAAKS